MGCYSCHGRHFPHPQRCTGRSRGANVGGKRPPLGVRETLRPGLAQSYRCTFFDREAASSHYQHRSDRHIRTLKRRHSSIQIRVPSSIFTARHTGLTTPRLAVESSFVPPRKSRVSSVTKTMTTNLTETHSVQRASGPCCATGCSMRANTHTSPVEHRVIRPALDGRDCLFGHQASVRPRYPSSRMVTRVPRTRVDRRSLQPRTGSQTVIPTPSSDSTKQDLPSYLPKHDSE